MPEFQGTKRFTPEDETEDCQSLNNREEGSNEKDKIDHNIQLPEQEVVLPENESGLPDGAKINSESMISSLGRSEEQPQGDLQNT